MKQLDKPQLLEVVFWVDFWLACVYLRYAAQVHRFVQLQLYSLAVPQAELPPTLSMQS